MRTLYSQIQRTFLSFCCGTCNSLSLPWGTKGLPRLASHTIYNFMLGVLQWQYYKEQEKWRQCRRLSGETCRGRLRHSPCCWENLKNAFLFSLCCFLRWLKVWSMVNCERGQHSTPRPTAPPPPLVECHVAHAAVEREREEREQVEKNK